MALLLVSAALTGCTGGGDDDGLPGEDERAGWTVSATYPNGTQTRYNVTSDPTVSDTDGDGLNDFKEVREGTDPRKIDTDEDRLLDGGNLCPSNDDPVTPKILDQGILEDPNESGCYLGEARKEIDGMTVTTDPTDAHTDSGARITDHLTDGEELAGWEVTVDGETYHVRSNPSIRSTDSDGEGLHDGLEKRLATDPQLEDTDDDGVSDLRDAAPLGNLVVEVEIERVNLKQDFRVSGGANLRVEMRASNTEASVGPRDVDSGQNRLGWTRTLDVLDEGSGFVEELDGSHASGNWDKPVRLEFFHDSSSGGSQEVEVRQANDHAHVLELSFDAFTDTWTGHARGGTSSGSDADVTIDVRGTVR